MTENVQFQIGDEVRSKINPEHRGLVTGILFRPHGVIYLVTWGMDLTERYNFAVELDGSITEAKV